MSCVKRKTGVRNPSQTDFVHQSVFSYKKPLVVHRPEDEVELSLGGWNHIGVKWESTPGVNAADTHLDKVEVDVCRAVGAVVLVRLGLKVQGMAGLAVLGVGLVGTLRSTVLKAVQIPHRERKGGGGEPLVSGDLKAGAV